MSAWPEASEGLPARYTNVEPGGPGMAAGACHRPRGRALRSTMSAMILVMNHGKESSRGNRAIGRIGGALRVTQICVWRGHGFAPRRNTGFFQKRLEVRFDDFPRDFHGPVSILTWSLCLCRETKSQFLEHVASPETKYAF